MVTVVSRRYRFSAAHRLHSARLSEAENQRVYGKCNNPYGHGHDYIFDVAVTGHLDSITGLLVRLSDLDRFVGEQVLSSFAHKNLNFDINEFEELVPTTENLALVIVERLRRKWPEYFPCSQARLSGIFMQETDRNSFEVFVRAPDQQTNDERIDLNESVIVNA